MIEPGTALDPLEGNQLIHSQTANKMALGCTPPGNSGVFAKGSPHSRPDLPLPAGWRSSVAFARPLLLRAKHRADKRHENRG
jgi:hypothetical protein